MGKGNRHGGRQNERPRPELQVTSPLAWKRPGVQGDLVELPSGNVVRCRRPGMQEFVELGMVPNDLIPIVDRAITEHVPPSMEEIIEDQSKLEATAQFMEAVLLHCVVEPEILPVPPNEDDGSPGEREEDVVYVDMVDMEDQVFIFQFAVGGTRSVQRFRQLQVTDVATVAAESFVVGQAERAARPA